MKKDLTRLNNIRLESLRIRKRIQQIIMDLPDNPNLKRMYRGFVITNKELGDGKSWSPRYYDFKGQYKEIANILESCESVPKVLQIIIDYGGYDHLYFHPDVIANIKKEMENNG